MNKQKKIKLIKILSIVVWIILLIIPTIVDLFDPVSFVKNTNYYNESTDSYIIEIECDKNIVSGEVEIGFYDEDDNLVLTSIIPFENNTGKIVKVEVSAENIPDSSEFGGGYLIEELYVSSETVEKINSVVYPVAIVYFVWIVYILSINIACVEKNGSEIEVRAGIRKHTMKINGEVVDERAKMFFLKPIILVAKKGGTQYIGEILANKRIRVYSKTLDILNDGEIIVKEEANTSIFSDDDKPEILRTEEVESDTNEE